MSQDSNDSDKKSFSLWSGILGATSSPLRFFALTVLVCNSVFGVVAGTAYEAEVFVYTLHTFLAVVAAFSLIALWSPRTFYGPDDIAQLIALEKDNDDKPLFPLVSRIVPTVVGLIGILIYAVYQGSK